MENIFHFLKTNGADLAITIKPNSVVTAPWTIYKCQFGCGRYNKSHCCPPKAPSYLQMRDIIDCFQTAVLFRCHEMRIVTPLAVTAARELFLDGYYKAIALGSGPCTKCTKCNPDFCNFPDQTVPAMEACGIDVFATVRANGLEIHTLKDRDEVQNHFGLLLIE